MGKVRWVLIAVLLLSVAAPAAPGKAEAQTGGPSCSGPLLPSPMPGHYTGPWHSDADYHFDAQFPAINGYPASERLIEMKVTIDGALDLTVTADGRVSGTATGNVTAPIFHDGQQDISGGVGTISGQVTGVFSPAGSLLVLSHPVIDMHWGTFGGHAVETFPVMSDYHLSASASDCISGGGSVDEEGFPEMNITNDSTGQLTQAPGIGEATGTWQVTSDSAARFQALSGQVDAFIANATSALQNAQTVTPNVVETDVVSPLKTLEATIGQDPTVARCLLERLQAWEAGEVGALLGTAQSLAGASDVATLREAGDLVRSAEELDLDCQVGTDPASTALLQGERSLLDSALASRSWSRAVLLMREILLLGRGAAQVAMWNEVRDDIHAQVLRGLEFPAALDVGRVAYALGDRSDAAVIAHSAPAGERWRSGPPWVLVKSSPRKHRKRARHSTPKSTPTPVPTPRSVRQILSSGVAGIMIARPSGSPPSFSWLPISGASAYIVSVVPQGSSSPLWLWSGTATSVQYGDTTLPDRPRSSEDGWPIALGGTGYTWSVLALDGNGRVIGLRLSARR